MKSSSESDILRACLELLRLRGIFAWRNNSTGIYDPAKKRFRSFQGMKGTSDILGIVPGTEGRLLAVECKGPRGRLSPDQEVFLEAVRRAGGVALCVRSVGELEDALGVFSHA